MIRWGKLMLFITICPGILQSNFGRLGGINLEKGSIHDHSVIHLFKNSFIKKNGRRKKKKVGIRILLLLGYGELKIQHFWNVMVVLRFAECSFWTYLPVFISQMIWIFRINQHLLDTRLLTSILAQRLTPITFKRYYYVEIILT